MKFNRIIWKVVMAEKASGATLMSGTKFVNARNESIQNGFEKTDIIQIKRKILQVIESLLEEKVTDKNLIESCQMLTKHDYADVVEERNIMDLCGYPLCSNHVVIPSQQFHIVSKVNRVYDINERKSFCSNICYKASCYLKHQLSETALWFQEDPVDLTILSDGDNSGSIGELIIMCPEKLLETEAKLKSEKDDCFTKEDKKLISDELSKCADAFKNLEVKEKNGVDATNPHGEGKWFRNVSAENIWSSTFHQNMKIKTSDCSEELNDTESDASDDEYFPSEEKYISEKLMPVLPIRKVKLPILIKSDKSLVNSPPVISNPVSLCKIQDILREWITTDTLRLLSAKVIDNNISQSAQTAIQHLSTINHTSNGTEDNNSWTAIHGVEKTVPEKPIVANNNETSEQTELMITTNPSIDMIKKYFQGEDLLQEKRKQPHVVKFKAGRKGGVKLIKNKASEPLIVPSLDAEEKYHLENSSTETDNSVLPKVDSLSQNGLRQQVVCTKLKNAFSDILPLIGLQFKVLGDTILNLVSTFRLTASNVMYKPNEWKLLAIVLFRVIMKSNIMKNRISKRYAEEDTFSILLKKSTVCEHLSIQDIDKANELFSCDILLEKST